MNKQRDEGFSISGRNSSDRQYSYGCVDESRGKKAVSHLHCFRIIPLPRTPAYACRSGLSGPAEPYCPVHGTKSCWLFLLHFYESALLFHTVAALYRVTVCANNTTRWQCDTRYRARPACGKSYAMFFNR